MTKARLLEILASRAELKDVQAPISEGVVVTVVVRYLAKGGHIYANGNVSINGKPWDGQNPTPDVVLGQFLPEFEKDRAELRRILNSLPEEMTSDVLRSKGWTKSDAPWKEPAKGKGTRAAGVPNRDKFPKGTRILETNSGKTWIIDGYTATAYVLKCGTETREVSRFNRYWKVQS